MLLHYKQYLPMGVNENVHSSGDRWWVPHERRNATASLTILEEASVKGHTVGPRTCWAVLPRHRYGRLLGDDLAAVADASGEVSESTTASLRYIDGVESVQAP